MRYKKQQKENKNLSSVFLRSPLILGFSSPIMRIPAASGIFMNWKITISNWATRILRHQSYSVATKLRLSIGLGLAVFAFGFSFVQPSSSLAIGGNPTMEVRPFGETVVTTLHSVQIPLKNYVVSQGYWWLHSGVDMASPIGEKIYPVMKGRVEFIERSRIGYGNHIIIKHSDQYESLYAHLSKILVKEGDEVDLNTVIGEVGSTGHSTGPHLHLEFRMDNQVVNPTALLFK